jgi:EcsC protein family
MGMAPPVGEPLEREEVRQRELPPSLWDRLRTDPARAPEYIALAASERHAPAAAAWLEERQRMYAHSPHDLAQMAKRKHAALARFGGAATGVGGIVTALPDLAAAAWIQSRLVFFIAAAYGYDPYDPMRPAELLVIRDLYETPQEARRALDGVGTMMVEAYAGSKMQRDEALAARLARFVGRRLTRRLAGRLIPFAAIAFNAIGNERETRALADKAIKFYGG